MNRSSLGARSCVPLFLLLGSLGCIVDADLGQTDSESTGTSGGSGSTGSSGSPATDSGSGVDSTSSVDSSGEGEPPELECPHGPAEPQCDVLAQDCPAGWHCIPWATVPGGQLDTTVCTPLVDEPRPRYSTCTPDLALCTDECGLGEYCFPTDGSDSGICLGLCSFDGDDDTCMAGEVCDTCAECSVGTCLGGCDPLAANCPGGAPTCVLSERDPGFVCLPIPEGNVPLDGECATVYDCAPGLVCLDSNVLDGCEGPFGCCTELCDLEDGDPGCSNPAHACVLLFLGDAPPPGQEHVGACTLPEADPCATPGNCPPPGIDDSVPWCSEANESACPDHALAGFVDAIACDQICTCELPCTDPSDCPVPLTGTATGACETPLGPGTQLTCVYSCASGEVCPDGMSCDDSLGFGAVCVWNSPVPPSECM